MKEIESLKDSYRLVFGANDGELVLKDLQSRFHCNSPSFSPDSHETAFREGQRSVVLFIQNMLVKQSLNVNSLEGYEDNVG